MAESGDRPGPGDREEGVLAGLPASRPKRIGGARADPQPAAAAVEDPRSGGTAKPKARAGSGATPRPGGTPKPKPRPKPVAARGRGTGRPAGVPTQSSGERSASGPPPKRRPQAVREGAPGIGPHEIPARDLPADRRPTGAELVDTAVRTGGRLATLGLAVGGHLLKRAVKRLPRP